MALHDDLLMLARQLVPSVAAPLGTPMSEVNLRRGVSTAYYALFHLLVHEAMARIIADPTLRSPIGRSFDHGRMKQVCQEYSGARVVAGALTVRPGLVIPPELQTIGTVFVDLQVARHTADYDTSIALHHLDADDRVQTAEIAFLEWGTCKTHPSSSVFLTDLFLRSVQKTR